MSTTTMSVLSWKRGMRDRLKSFGCAMGTPSVAVNTDGPTHRRDIASSVKKVEASKTPRYAALSLHAVTNFHL